MPRPRRKPQSPPDIDTDAAPAKPRRAKPAPRQQQDHPSCPIPRPDDPDAPLTPDEEDAYALIGDIADIQAQAKAEDGPDGSKPRPKPPQKSRVEFSRLSVRARGIRYLLDYFAGVPPSKSLKALGLSWGDLTICRLSSPQFEKIYQFCRYQMGERLQDKALQAVERALDGADIGSAAAQSARFVLERLTRGDYEDPRYRLAQRQRAAICGTGGGIAYQINIINTAAPVDAAKLQSQTRHLCGDCVDIHADESQTQ